MNLSVLESAPIIGGILLSLVFLVKNILREKIDLRFGIKNIKDMVEGAISPVDALAALISVVLILTYLPELPTNHSYTVRYLHPIYPLAIYGVFRTPVISRVVIKHTKAIIWTYEGVVLFGLPITYILLYVYSPATGDVYQSYAVVALMLAGLVILSGSYAILRDTEGQLFAVTIGCVVGVATVFYVLNAYILVHYGISPFPFLEEVLAHARLAILQN